ncbi:MAG: hypothetical protein WC285_01495 [Candidatus Gracilibacteria bacterium]|jgi:hypothetical protein
MKKHNLYGIILIVLIVVGISMLFATGNLQGLMRLNPQINAIKLKQSLPLENPEISLSKSSCNQKAFKAAFILLVKDPQDATKAILTEANLQKEQTAIQFATATGNLATINTSDPLVIIKNDNWETPQISLKTVNEFYKTHKDIYDFIIIYKIFDEDEQLTNGFYISVNRNIQGIGLSIENVASEYGSNGYLKGIIVLRGRLLNPNYTSDRFYPINVILHEIGHRWGVGVGDDFTGTGGDLEIKSMNIHFHTGLQSPSTTGDPMYSAFWVANGDGTFRISNADGYRKYHPFMLYFMGLLPKSEYETSYTIFDSVIDANGEITNRPYKQISVNDIIAVEGERKCD